jgi:hypothetical protein
MNDTTIYQLPKLFLPVIRCALGDGAMAWFYEIRDANGEVFQTKGGFTTERDAMIAAVKEQDRLNASGKIPEIGFGKITSGQDEQEPWQ